MNEVNTTKIEDLQKACDDYLNQTFDLQKQKERTVEDHRKLKVDYDNMLENEKLLKDQIGLLNEQVADGGRKASLLTDFQDRLKEAINDIKNLEEVIQEKEEIINRLNNNNRE